MAEGHGVYVGPTQTEFVVRERRDFQKEVHTCLKENPACLGLTKAAYQRLYGQTRDIDYVPSCKLDQVLQGRKLKIDLNYEAHGTFEGKMFRSTVEFLMMLGKVILFTESDMAPTQFVGSELVINRGLLRSLSRDFLNLERVSQALAFGVDDSYVRAFLIVPGYTGLDSNLGVVTEVFRNPFLRDMLEKIEPEEFQKFMTHHLRYPNLEDLHDQLTTLKGLLAVLDAAPRADIGTLEDMDFDALRYFMAIKLAKLEPELARLPDFMRYEIRDETMTRAIVERLCDPALVNQVGRGLMVLDKGDHPIDAAQVVSAEVLLGFLHVDGIGRRLNQILRSQGVNFEIFENNMMQLEEDPVPFVDQAID